MERTEPLRPARQKAGGGSLQRSRTPQEWSAPVDKTALVGPDIEEGRSFLALLKNKGIKVNAALWQKDEVFGRWSLVIVTPLVETLGPKETYRQLRDILKSEPLNIDLLHVSLFTPKASFYKSLHRELPHVKDLTVSKQPIGGHFVEDGFIYFVK